MNFLSDFTAPTDVTVTQTGTPTVLQVTWTAPQGMHVDQYKLGYSQTGISDFTYVTTPSASTHFTLTLGKVEPGDYISVYVQAVCGSEARGNWSVNGYIRIPKEHSKSTCCFSVSLM